MYILFAYNNSIFKINAETSKINTNVIHKTVFTLNIAREQDGKLKICTFNYQYSVVYYSVHFYKYLLGFYIYTSDTYFILLFKCIRVISAYC